MKPEQYVIIRVHLFSFFTVLTYRRREHSESPRCLNSD